MNKEEDYTKDGWVIDLREKFKGVEFSGFSHVSVTDGDGKNVEHPDDKIIVMGNHSWEFVDYPLIKEDPKK